MSRNRGSRTSRVSVERLESRELLTARIALIDTGVNLTSPTDSPYYDFTDAFDAYDNQSAASNHNLVQENFLLGANGAAHGSIVADEIVSGIKATKPDATGSDVQIVPIRDTNPANGTEDTVALVRGIFYAAYHGFAVINISAVIPSDDINYTQGYMYIGNNPDPNYTNTRITMQDALNYATSKGCTIVTSGGNNHWDLDSTDTNSSDSTYNGWYAQGVNPYFAWAHPSNMIVAAAVDSSNNVVSDYGATHVDLGAPAVQNAASYADGYVSGIVGTLAALRPDLSDDGLVSVVKSTAQTYPQLAGMLSTGGVISPSNAVASLLGPGIVTAASANPSPASGTTASLSVVGSDPNGESSLTYTWQATWTPPGAQSPTFSANGTNAAKNTTATFYHAGNYTFQVTLSDGSATATSSVSVTVNQTLTRITISPVGASLTNGASQTFAAAGLDQFGNSLATQPTFTWTVNAGGVGGTINSGGTYAAPSTGTGSDTIVATSGSVQGTDSVKVASSGAHVQGTIIDPVNALSTTQYSNGPIYTVNGSGLSSLLPTGTATPATYPTVDTTFNNNWVSANGQSGAETLTFQLVNSTDSPVNLAGFHYWAYSSDQPQRSILTADVWTSPDNTAGSYTPQGTYNFYRGNYAQDAGRDYVLSATGVRYVQFRNLTNYGPDQYGSFVGLSEIRFVQSSQGTLVDRSTNAGGTASAKNSNPPNQVAANLFDGDLTTTWLDFESSSWVKYEFANNAAYVITQYQVTSGRDTATYPGRAPKNWVFQGSNTPTDDTTWVSLDTQTNQADILNVDTKTYNFTNTTAYKAYRLLITQSNGDNILQLTELKLLGPGAATTELAQGKTAVASSTENSSETADKAVDGDSTTRWSSGQWTQPTSTGWIYVDLGAVHSITEVVLNWETAYAVDYQIQVSNDASDPNAWTNIATITGNSTSGVHDYTGLSGSGRYVRILCTAVSTANNNYSLYDFKVYGS